MKKLFFFFLIIASFKAFSQEFPDSTKTRFGVTVSMLNPISFLIGGSADNGVYRYPNIFSNNYHSALGLEINYDKMINKDWAIGGILGFWNMSIAQEGKLNLPKSIAFLLKIGISANKITKKNDLFKTYWGGDLNYHLLTYASDSLQKEFNSKQINTSAIGIAPNAGFMFAVSPNLNINFNLCWNFLVPLNNYSGIWQSSRLGIGLIYDFKK